MNPKAYVAPPKGDPNFPAMFWHPETAEMRVFKSAAEVPEGWLDTHPANAQAVKANAAPAQAAAPKPAAAKGNGLPMTREQITIALLEGGVQFKRSAKDKELYQLLMVEAKRVLDERGVVYPADADAPTLLELLPKPE